MVWNRENASSLLHPGHAATSGDRVCRSLVSSSLPPFSLRPRRNFPDEFSLSLFLSISFFAVGYRREGWNNNYAVNALEEYGSVDGRFTDEISKRKFICDFRC